MIFYGNIQYRDPFHENKMAVFVRGHEPRYEYFQIFRAMIINQQRVHLFGI